MYHSQYSAANAIGDGNTESMIGEPSQSAEGISIARRVGE